MANYTHKKQQIEYVWYIPTELPKIPEYKIS